MVNQYNNSIVRKQHRFCPSITNNYNIARKHAPSGISSLALPKSWVTYNEGNTQHVSPRCITDIGYVDKPARCTEMLNKIAATASVFLDANLNFDNIIMDEKGQRNKQGKMEEDANQLYRRPQMTGQARDEEANQLYRRTPR